jgi:hypothetical protein
MDAYLSKPIDRAQFEAVLREILSEPAGAEAAVASA